MDGEENIDQVPKSNDTPEDVNENASHEQTIEQPKTQSENMEVHHHPDLHHKKKNFKEYFLEFLMIFIAVTLGFFAESYREHLSDRSKEKELMRSMVQDLKDDSTMDTNGVLSFTYIFKNVDTMLNCLKSDAPDPAIINRIVSHSFWIYSDYSYNNRTIQELKNAGNFRLILKNAVADSIIQYDNLMTTMLAQYNDLKNTMYSYKEVEARVVPYKRLNLNTFDSSDFIHTDTPAFISRDKELLSLYYNRLFIHEALGHIFIRNLKM